MKKSILLILAVCIIALTSSIPANNTGPINNHGQQVNTEVMAEAQNISVTNDENTEVPFPLFDFFILVIFGFFLARKHQSLEKKHRDLLNKHKIEMSSDSIFYP